jgi:ABC-type multidrug transport system fused ATPase/permease subunit
MAGWQPQNTLSVVIFILLVVLTVLSVATHRTSAAIIGVAVILVYIFQQYVTATNQNNTLLKQQESAETVRANAIELSKQIAAFATEYDQKETEIVLQYKTLPLEWKRIAAEEKTEYNEASEEYSQRFDGRIGQIIEQLRPLGITLRHDPADSFGSPVHPEAWRSTAIDLETAANRIQSSNSKPRAIDWLTPTLEWYGAACFILYVFLLAGLFGRDASFLSGVLK